MAAQTKSRTSSRAGSSRANTRKTRANGATGASTRTAEASARTNEKVFEEAADRIRGLNERILEASHKAGNTYLDTYEKTLTRIADFQEKVAEAKPGRLARHDADAQADFTRGLTRRRPPRLASSSSRDAGMPVARGSRSSCTGRARRRRRPVLVMGLGMNATGWWQTVPVLAGASGC